MLVVHTAESPSLRTSDLELSPIEVDNGTAMMDMLLLVETGERLRGVLEYNADIFDEPSVASILEQFESLVSSAVANPAETVSALSLGPGGDWASDVNDSTDLLPPIPEGLLLHQLFEMQAVKAPDRVAAVSDGRTISYEDIDLRSTRLAGKLRSMGVGPGELVVVCLEPSIELVIALLSVLKAGGAYVPIDASFPDARVAQIVRQTKPRVTLAGESTAGQFKSESNLLIATTDWAEIPAAEEVEAAALIDPEDPAYVMFTSGSTGVPKGVMVSHRAICNQVVARGSAFSISESDAVLQRTPLAFDPALWEFFGPLSCGGRIVIAGSEEQSDPRKISRLVAENGVTAIQVVPTLLKHLLDEPEFCRSQSLTHVFCGGEVLTRQLRDAFFDACRGSLHNMYGPCECAVDATYWTCDPSDERELVPIGRPIAGVRVSVLDSRLRPVPPGIVGEICIAGRCVGSGYMGDPDLTAQRFISDPHDLTAKSLLYRTGDLGRVRRDGAIEYLGRADNQLKVQGVRIEPAEVEAVIERHPSIKEAMVTERANAQGEKQLVAYVAGSGDA